jgi:hypothetical protein
MKEGHAPVWGDPDRRVRFIDQSWFFDHSSFWGPTGVVMVRGLKILREERVVSLPRLVEWLPEFLETCKWSSDLKRWPVGPEMVRAGEPA